MKKTMMAGGLAAISLAALIAGAATAQNAPTAQHAARHARADTDGDNRISQAEFVQARAGRLTALDADRDGALTGQEVRARMQTRMAERRGLRFDRLDADKDGAISRTEFETQRAQRADGAGPRHRGPRMRQRMATPPAGAAPGARQARAPLLIAEVETRAAAAFARLDANHDGYVTADERRAARMAMRETRQERRAERMARRAARPMSASPPAPASE